MSLPENYLEAEKILSKALESGLTYFDTADLYQKGKNEENLGRFLKEKRYRVKLASKVGNQLIPGGDSWTWNPSKAYILQAIDQTLKRLQTDYLDLYQLHGGTLEDPWEETLEAFEILKAQGKILEFGISSIRPNVIRKVMSMNPPATVMMQYSPLDRRPEERVFPFLENTSTRVLVRGGLAKGILIDKSIHGFLDFNADEIGKIKLAIQATGYSPESVLIKYALTPKAVGGMIIGASSSDQILKMVKGYGESLNIPDQVIQKLKEEFPANLYQDHR